MGTTVTAIAVIDDPTGAVRRRTSANDHDDGDAPGDVDAPDPGESPPSRPWCRRRRWCSRTSVTPAPTCSATADSGASRSTTATSRNWSSTGHITDDEARTHPRRNIITRALGIEPDVKVDWWTLPLVRGDRFVLCSDGLVDEMADTDISRRAARQQRPPGPPPKACVEMANAAGGRDNITVIVVDVLDGDEPPDPTLEIDVVPTWADDANRPDRGRHPVARRRRPIGHHGRPGGSDGTPRPIDTRRSRHEAPIRPGEVRRGCSASQPWPWWASSCSRRGPAAATSSPSTTTTRRSSTRAARVACSGSIRRRRTTVAPTRDQLEDDRAEMIDEGIRFDSQEEAVDFLRDSATTTDDDDHHHARPRRPPPRRCRRPTRSAAPSSRPRTTPHRPGPRRPLRHEPATRPRRRPAGPPLHRLVTVRPAAAQHRDDAAGHGGAHHRRRRTRSPRSARTPRSRPASSSSSGSCSAC